MKEEVYQLVLEILEQKIKTLQESITSIQEARNNETKSSFGDKYETGRAVMQAELDKQVLILQNLLQQKDDILKVQITKPSEKIVFGSWVETNQGNYLIALGIGRVKDKDKDKDKEAFVISLASPLGKALKGLKLGDKIIFQNKEYKIKSIK